MITLSYGYKKPQTGDRGSTFFTGMEDNIQRLNDHNHDGTNSVKLTAQSITGVTQTISSGSWISYTANGETNHYRQQVTLPAGFGYDNVSISFRLADGSYVYPTIEKVSNTQYYIYTTDNTLNYTAVYGG